MDKKYDTSTEDAVVGCAILYPEASVAYLDSKDFQDSTNRKIVSSLIELRESKTPIDIITLTWKLREVDYSITPDVIEKKITWNFTTSALTQYIKKLKENRRLRESERVGEELLKFSDWTPSQLKAFAKRIEDISNIWIQSDSSVKYSDVERAYTQVMERMGKKIYWYSWWAQFAFLDDNTKGLLKKKVYRIGAPSWVGKTQFVYNMIPELLKQKNPDGTDVKIAFFTLENAKEDTLTAIMCKQARINQFKLNSWEVEGNWDYLTELEGRLFVIDDVYELDSIFSTINSISPDIVILDYISYVTINKCSEDQKYTEYARKVVWFAKNSNLVWIDLSNLANDTQTNEEIRFKPKFYWSSLLVNNSDVNIFILRNEEFKKTKDKVLQNRFDYSQENLDFFKTRNILDVCITKNRWGPPWYEMTYWVNQDNGWIYSELSKKDMDNLWARFW